MPGVVPADHDMTQSPPSSSPIPPAPLPQWTRRTLEGTKELPDKEHEEDNFSVADSCSGTTSCGVAENNFSVVDSCSGTTSCGVAGDPHTIMCHRSCSGYKHTK